MRRIFFKRKMSSIAPYWGAAILSIGALGYVLFDMGKQHPFGEPLKYSTLSRTADQANHRFEIVYFDAANCKWCTQIKQVHLPRWREYDMSRKVQLTIRPAEIDCTQATTYAYACQELLAQKPKPTSGQIWDVNKRREPAFSLIDRMTGQVVKSGHGIDIFYELSMEASRQMEQNAATAYKLDPNDKPAA